MKNTRTQLNDARIVEAIRLLRDADSVEIKLTVPESDRLSATQALNMDVLDAELRQVVFFDTSDLALNAAGVVVRARRIRKGGDTVVKLRPVVPAALPDKLRRSNSFSIELDVMPGSFVCSGALKAKVDNSDVSDVLRGNRLIRKLFLPDQRSLYKEYAPEGLDINSLIPFGPINVAKLKFSAEKLSGRAAVAEMWFYPDGSRILELSTKCATDEAFQVLAETRAFLKQRGLDLTGERETKTHKALEYFSRLHSGQARSAG